MISSNVRAYLTFTKKERIGLLSIVLIILILFFLPCFFSSPIRQNDLIALKEFQSEISRLQPAAPESARPEHRVVFRSAQTTYSRNAASKREDYRQVSMFYFDPNVASDSVWKALGVRERTVQTIRKYVEHGGRFRSPDDIDKIYGLHETDAARLKSFVRISEKHSSLSAVNHSDKSSPNVVRTIGKPKQIVDVNKADSIELVSLRGIGARLASRILAFRQKLGGFYSVDQVSEVYALPDSTFVAIKPMLTIGDSSVQLIDVNSADASLLKQHPYIRWNLANAIVQYRQQHGPFHSVDDLQQIAIITPDLFSKLSHYLQIKTL